jgi:hypothetical protein
MVFAVAASCGGRAGLVVSPGASDGAAGAAGSSPAGRGGATGSGACVTASECPAPAGPCESASCEAGRCAVVPVAAGAFVALGQPADCFATVCDGAGGLVKVLDLHNVPAAAECMLDACDASGRVSSRPLVAGAPCGNGLCDGAGACVGCLADTDCGGTQRCGPTHACMPPSCADGVQNGAESDVDCGGGACARCANGERCTYDADCASALCRLSDHTCGAPTCTDQRKDGDETDIDCGGSCPPCAASAECKVDADCLSKACYSGITHRCLLDHCLDGHKDFDETDRDCGGSSCARCADFSQCKQDSDCHSTHCTLPRGWCLTERCFDGVIEPNETDVDCGGGLCAQCALGQSCGIDYDCASGACDFLSRTCITDTCADHRFENGETDIDCGGKCGATCKLGKNCQSTSDCAPGLTCNYWKECG